MIFKLLKWNRTILTRKLFKVFIITYLIALFQKAMEPGGDLVVSMAGWVSSFIPADSFFSENLSFHKAGRCQCTQIKKKIHLAEEDLKIKKYSLETK